MAVEEYRQPLYQEIRLGVLDRWDHDVAIGETVAIDIEHPVARLYLRINLAQGDPEQQFIRVRFINHPGMGDDRFIMIRVVESPGPAFARPPCCKILKDVYKHIIIIV